MNLRSLVVIAATWTLAACGGGGGNSSGDTGKDANGQQGGDRVSIAATSATQTVPSLLNADLDFLVANPGNAAANNVVMSVTLGSGLSKAGVLCTQAQGGAVCPADPNTLRIATLPAGSSLHMKVSVIPIAGASGVIESTASVTEANDTTPSNNSANVSLRVYSADLSVAGSTTVAQLANGVSVPYSLTVTNSGPDAAPNVTLENELSSGQTLTSMTCTAAGAAICPATSGPKMQIPSFPSGGSLTFDVTAQLSGDPVASVNDTLRATSLGDKNLKNSTATVSALTRIPTSLASPSFVELKSDLGDYVGSNHLGARYSYSNANATFEVYSDGGQLTVRVHGDESWNALFDMSGDGVTSLRPGTYSMATSFSPNTGHFDWSGESRGCSHNGWFKIDDVVYVAGQIRSIDLRFEQHCEGVTAALRGQIHWNAQDASRPPGPVDPPLPGLWQPAANATPASGNYMYLESDAGDFVGQGQTLTFTQANSVLSVNSHAEQLEMSAIGNVGFHALFAPMTPLTQLQPGYYANVQRFPFGNPALGRMQASLESHDCNDLSGWFVIDSIAVSGAAITAVDLRFEQHCEKAAPSLRGKIHWRSDDPTQPAGPQQPPPAGLWAPPAGVIPATGNAVYLESDVGDFIGKGISRLYTPLDSIISRDNGGILPAGNRFNIGVDNNDSWQGYFQAMITLPDLQPGYYANVSGFPSHNPAFGGLDWAGNSRACDESTGWFVIDTVAYVGNSLDSMQLRFEQHCEGGTPALHGFVRWSAADTRLPLPPQTPIPALWTTPSNVAPARGNFVYLESDAGDFIGRGQTYLFTPTDTTFTLDTTDNVTAVRLDAANDVVWIGNFIPMVPFKQLQVGYYGNASAGDRARGAFSWGGAGRGCQNDKPGQQWFAVDSVTYSGTTLTALDLRFQESCGATGPTLRGQIHWSADNH